MEFIFLRLLDILGLIFNIIACLTIVRLPLMIMQFAELHNLVEWRTIGLLHFLIFISDLPAMIGGLVLLLTVYRMFPLCEELKEKDCHWDTSKQVGDIYYSGWKPRKIILKHFALLIVDIMCIPAGLICLCSWRCVIFIKALQEAKDPLERRKACFVQFLNIFLDIPCLILYLICCCTWRLPLIINGLMKYHRDERNNWKWDNIRYFSFYHFGLLLLDIPCLVSSVLLMFTWRAPFFIRKVKKINLFQETGETKARKLAIVQFLLLFVDIPCIIFFLLVTLTFWRLPFFIQDCKAAIKKKNRQWIIRKATITQVGLLFVDLGCFILSLIILLTLWRVYPLVQAIRKIFRPKESDEQGPSEGVQVHVKSSAKNDPLNQSPDASAKSEGDQSMECQVEERREDDTMPHDIDTAEIQREESSQGNHQQFFHMLTRYINQL